MKKIFFAFATCSVGLCQNLLVNGNFQEPAINSDWTILSSLKGWKVSQIEKGTGKIYNSRWGQRAVLELDANKNVCIQQSIVLEEGTYNFGIDYAARSGCVSTSAMSIKWNGQQVDRVIPSDQQIHSLNLALYSISGDNTIQICGEGKSDSLGMTIGNLRLQKMEKNLKLEQNKLQPKDLKKNLILNGQFTEPKLSSNYEFLHKLPNWQIKQIERGVGQVYNPRWGYTVVIQLDSNQNDYLKQTVQLKEGSTYELLIDYAARTGFIDTSKMSIHINDKQICSINSSDDNIYTYRHKFLSEQKQTRIQIRGEGPSDSFGMTISNIRLYEKEENPIQWLISKLEKLNSRLMKKP